MNKFFSIIIPCYEMKGLGVQFLNFSLQKLERQEFKDFEVIVTDQSSDSNIMKLCEFWSSRIDIKYLNAFNLEHKFSTNTNNGILNSSGLWLKFICQDDFLLNEYSLMKIHDHISSNTGINWLATACFHSNDGVNFYRPFHPKWNKDLVFGNNSISSPTVICVKNSKTIPLFDDNLEWLVDCEWYHRLYNLHGEPHYIQDYIVVNRTWGDRLSDNISLETKQRELDYIKKLIKS